MKDCFRPWAECSFASRHRRRQLEDGAFTAVRPSSGGCAIERAIQPEDQSAIRPPPARAIVEKSVERREAPTRARWLQPEYHPASGGMSRRRAHTLLTTILGYSIEISSAINRQAVLWVGPVRSAGELMNHLIRLCLR